MEAAQNSDSVPPPTRSRLVIASTITLITLVLASAPLITFYEGEANTLQKNRKWLVFKTKLATDVMGEKSYYSGPQALAGNRLNLAAWHGYQEVLLREKVRPKLISFDFRLSAEGYVVVEFDREYTGNFFGFRLSTSDTYPHAALEIEREGEFISKELIERPKLSPDSWHSARLVFLRDSVTLYVNDDPWAQMPYQASDAQWVGFRAGSADAAVDNVIVEDRTRGRVIAERFDNRWELFGGLWRPIGMGLCLALLVLVGLRWYSGTWVDALWNLTALHLCVAAATIPLAGYRMFVMSRHYPAEVTLMREEEEWVARRFEFRQDRLEEKHELNAPDDRMRVLFIGTSQTYGAGASELEERWVDRIQASLDPPPSGLPKIECINTAIPGEVSASLVRHYSNHWIDYSPDLVVINLSVNDAKRTDLGDNLHKFVQVNRERGIDTLFVLEAISFEDKREELFTHEIMRSVGEELGVPVLDSRGHVNKHYDDGFLWWDSVHPTSYGHRLIAEFLMPHVVEGLQRAAPRVKS